MRTHRLKTRLTVMALALLSPLGADAAGLGRLNVQSALGQVLNAEIELIAVKRGEAITARLAPLEVYQRQNAQLNPALTGTRVTVEKRANGEVYLKVTTPRPIEEPYIELIVELNSESGRVTRQYTALLDPPGYGRGAADLQPRQDVQPPAVAAPQAPSAERVPDPAATTASPPGAAPAAAARAPIRPKAEPARSAGAKEYGPIKPGETLGQIARSLKLDGATLQQALIALQRHNPDAFIRKNINLVKSGKILKIPEPEEIAAIGQSEAVREVRVQVADFNAYRNRLAEHVANAPEGGSPSRGRIGAAVSDSASAEAKDTVRVSRGEPAGKSAAATGTPDERIRALEEEAVARQRALAEANERIGNLEKTIKDMQRLVELKSAAAMGTQQTSKAVPEQTAPRAAEQTPAKAAEPRAPLPTESVIARESPGDAKATAGAARTPGSSESARGDPPPSTTAKGASSDAAGVGQAQSAVSAPATDKVDSTPAPKPAATPVTPVTPAADAQPSIFGEVLKEPLYLALGAAVALLGALGIATARRRRAAATGRGTDDKIMPTLGARLGLSAAGTSATANSPSPAPVAGTAVQQQAATPLSAKPAVPDRTAVRNDNDLDFDLSPNREAALTPSSIQKTVTTGFEGSAVPAQSPSKAPAPEEHGRSESDRHPVSGTEEPVAAASKPSNVIDFDLDSPQPVRAAIDSAAEERVSSEAPARDFEFKLDLDNLELAAPNEPKTPPRDDHWYDVQQKFDLAKAYEEMGDRNGARDILQEVLKEGDSEQQDKATKLLTALA